jgi:class 3 adenylate cyclase
MATTGPAEPVRAEVLGREPTLALIARWAELAFTQAPRVGFVVGAAGVGKSSVLHEAGRRAADRGARVLTGDCGSGVGVPYLPVIAALRPLIDGARQGHRPDLGPADLDAIDRMEGRGPADEGPDRDLPAEGAGSGPMAFLAVTRLVLGASRARPTVLLLDDLHDADDASLALLEHLLAAVGPGDPAPNRLLVLVAVRPDGGTPVVRRRLERLRHADGTAEATLDGLDELAMNDLLAGLGRGRPSRSLLRDMCEQTAGNPLFARLLWSHLLDSGAAAASGGVVQLLDPAAPQVARVPLERIVDLRVDGVSPECRTLLGQASVLGSLGRVDELAAAADLDPDRLDDLLEEAEEAGLLEVSGDGYRFLHPLLAAAVARQGSARRRRAEHLRVARILERLHGDEAAPRIVQHLRAAGPDAPPDERRRSGVLAATRATAIGAWGAAADAYDLALGDGVDLGFGEAQRSDLHRGAAEAAIGDQDPVSCERHALVASELGRELGDLQRWGLGLAALLRGRAKTIQAGARFDDDPSDAFLVAAGGEVPQVVALVRGLRSEIRFACFDFDDGRAEAARARNAAERAGAADVIAFVDFVEGLQFQGVFDLDGSEACFGRGAAAFGESPAVARWCRARLATSAWIRGDLDDAGGRLAASEAEAEAVQDWGELSLIHAWWSATTAASGRWADAEERAIRALQLHRRTDYEFASVVTTPPLAVARAVRGDVEGALAAVEDWRRRGVGRMADQLELLLLALGGRTDELDVRVAAVTAPARRPGPLTLRNASASLVRVEIAAALGRPEHAAGAAAALADLHARGVRLCPGHVSLVSRLAGVAHGLEGDDEAAERWWAAATDEATVAGASGELARVDLDRAEHGLRCGKLTHRDAAPLLARAASAFDSLGMLPLLRRTEQALGSAPGSGTRRVKAILFTDLVDSTALNVAVGNEDFMELLRTHDRITRSILREHDGVEFKHTGDGLAAWFASGALAVEAALAMQEHLEGLVHADSGRRVQIRCGLAAGEPIEESGDLFGLSVVRAARVCALAGAGEVLASEEIHAMAGPAPVEFEDHGFHQLKGLPGPTAIRRARRA